MRVKDNDLLEAIKRTKYRIMKCEQLGIASTTIREKAKLQKQERMLKVREQESGRKFHLNKIEPSKRNTK